MFLSLYNFYIFVRFIRLQLHDELMTSSVGEPAQEGQIHKQCNYTDLVSSVFLSVPKGLYLLSFTLALYSVWNILAEEFRVVLSPLRKKEKDSHVIH